MPAKKSAKYPTAKEVATLKHAEAKRKNIPTAEHQSVLRNEDQNPVRVAYPRNTDLDPQLVWRGKDEQDWSDLVVHAPPLYIQEKVHPKALIDDLLRQTKEKQHEQGDLTPDLFADFNGIPKGADKTEFYQHDQNWSNRMILGDSLQVMASLAEREGLRGKVQCIYFDPPYGIRFNSNFQWSTTSRDVKDGNVAHITREPEQVKAFRDTWRDGIHSYLTYLRDRLIVARDLLTDSGSIFVQIGDENVHRVRAVMDEVFGDENCVCMIAVAKTTSATTELLPPICYYIVWYSKSLQATKYRQLFMRKIAGETGATGYTKIRLSDGSIRVLTTDERDGKAELPAGGRILATGDLTSQRPPGDFPVTFKGKVFRPVKGYWKTGEAGFPKIIKAERVADSSGGRLAYIRYLEDFPAFPITNVWSDTVGQNQFAGDKIYVVQTANRIIERCVLMSTDPGDLVLDPTCGSGTTATVAEQWGRRWITIDTSRVALALARARIMGARYPFYLLADSRDGQMKEAEITRTAPSSKPVHGNIRHGFVYERVPHITLKSIANNAEIDVIWDKWQTELEPLREALNKALKQAWEEWEIPREAEDPWPSKTAELFYKLRSEEDKGKDSNEARTAEWLNAINHNLKRTYTLKTLPSRPADPWPEAPTKLHAAWWQARISRQKEIDASIAAKAESEFLYDKPYENKKCVRVAGPFTVESISPHRVLHVGADDELIDTWNKVAEDVTKQQDFSTVILDNLASAGVQQAHKEDRITFSSLLPWPGELICAEGRYQEGDTVRRAGIFIGPEFGTVSRPDLVAAAREAGDAGFDVLIACAFSYDAHSAEFEKLGRIPVLKARMNADLHMAGELKNTGKGNLFVIFGEPDISILPQPDGLLKVKVNGVDVFHPQTGEVRSDGPEGIACWFIDTDYNEESFFVRHAYFLGQNDPYKSLKTTLKAEIDQDAWASLNSDTSRPFHKPTTGRIAVKVINHLGDEVMKVFGV